MGAYSREGITDRENLSGREKLRKAQGRENLSREKLLTGREKLRKAQGLNGTATV